MNEEARIVIPNGASACSIAYRLARVGVPRWNYPIDAGDFSRCEKFLDDYPFLRPLLHQMGDVSKYWKRLVSRWDEIRATPVVSRTALITAVLASPSPGDNTDVIQLWWFLDDEREPVERPDRHWVIFRTGEALIEMLRRVAPDGLPDGISFDHDLDENRMSGHDVAKAIVEMVLDGELRVFDDFQYVVHSQNPIGSKNILDTMRDLERIEIQH